MRPHVLLHDIGLGVSPPRCPPPLPLRARSACVSLLRFSGYVFVVNMLGVHTAALVILGRFSHTLYISYTVTYGLATYLGLTFIPVIGRAPLDNMCASSLQRCCCHAPIIPPHPPPPLTPSGSTWAPCSCSAQSSSWRCLPSPCACAFSRHVTSLALLSQVWQIYKDRLHKSGASEEQLEAAYRQFKTYVAGAFIVAFFLFVYVNSPPAPCPMPPPPLPRASPHVSPSATLAKWAPSPCACAACSSSTRAQATLSWTPSQNTKPPLTTSTGSELCRGPPSCCVCCTRVFDSCV